jgi:tetratricopeptide (TPR) repeat protein/tRNA A-37 threonylcarbamoyl transferase component Bud32
METEERIDSLIDRWEDLERCGTPLTIEDLCSDCPELATEVRRRIALLKAIGSALDTPEAEQWPTTGDRGPDAAAAHRPPAVVRATAVYRTGSHLRHGGLGIVFTAHQQELDRTVALKRIRPDKLHDAARRRFLREAALTARLQHPGIVPIYGLGEDDDGPFYAMPLIQGRTLQEAIEAFHGDEALRRDAGRRRLRFRELLQQFVAACNTVAYAHDQGVVHRDLKPSNLMLGPYGETLVLDWGLAKPVVDDDATSEPGGEAPAAGASPEELTATGVVLGTPQYMSPEQARGEPAGPAGDIFGLGLVLYAILTGESAFDESSFRGADPLKAVREAAIVPPRRWDPGLAPPLEAICLKALAARPEGRYATARALGDDVTRWLGDEPVTAWREPVTVRARRWARRHRMAVMAAVVALAAGAIGLGAVAAVQARANVRLKRARDATAEALAATQRALNESEESRQQAEAVKTFLVEAFRSPDPSQDGRQVKVVDVLERAGQRLDKESAGSPATQGLLLDALGQTYRGLGLYDRAVILHTKARAVREAALGSDHPATLTSSYFMANAYRNAGRLSDATALHEATLKLREAKLGPDHPDTIASRGSLASAYAVAGRLPEAIPLFEATLKWREAKQGADHPDTIASRGNLANAYATAGRLPEAIPLFEATLKLREAKQGPDHPDTLISRHNLAIAYRIAGRTSEAIAQHKATLRSQEARLGSDHPDTLRSRANLAIAYNEAGRLSEAIALDEATLKLCEAKLGPDHPDTLVNRFSLANDYGAVGRWSEAIPLYETARKRFEIKLGPDHPDTLRSYHNLAVAYSGAGRLPEAIASFEAMVKVQEARLGPDDPVTLRSRHGLAAVYQSAGRLPQAIALFEATLQSRDAKLGPDHPDTLESRNGLASAYDSLGWGAEAERLYRDVLARRRKTIQPDSPRLAEDLAVLAGNLLEQARWSEAEPLLREALAIREKATPDDWRRYDAMSLLGGALMDQGRQAEAEPLVVAGYEGMKAREPRITVLERPRLRQAAERVVHLYEGWGRPEEAAVWKAKVGMPDLPADVFARP